mgnify:CR=1 FL=1
MGYAVIPAKAGIQRLYRSHWIPAFAGMTAWGFQVSAASTMLCASLNSACKCASSLKLSA